MSDIRDDIKEYLKLDPSADDEELLKALKEEIKKYHPTGLEGEESSSVKTEQFHAIYKLYKEFKAILDREKKNSTALVPYEAQALAIANEMDQIQSFYEIVQLKEKVRRLEYNREANQDRIQILEKDNKQLTEQIAQLRIERDNKEKEQLLYLYQQNAKKRTWGFLSLAAGLVTAIPACSKFLTEILGGVSTSIITILFFVAAIIVFIDWIYCKLRSIVVNEIACQFMDGAYLEENLPIKKKISYGSTYNYYVSEQSLRAKISDSFNSKIRIILFFFDRNTAVEHVKRLVISHFIEFDQFKDRETQKFDTLFRIRFSEKDTEYTI